jgi:hypothetical protein
MEEAFAAGNILTAAGFDLILKGENAVTLTAKRVAERLRLFIDAAKAARARVNPALDGCEGFDDGEFVQAFPHYCSVKDL